MYNSIKEFKIGNIKVKIFSANPNSDQIESIERSINKAFNNFNTAFCGGQPKQYKYWCDACCRYLLVCLFEL